MASDQAACLADMRCELEQAVDVYRILCKDDNDYPLELLQMFISPSGDSVTSKEELLQHIKRLAYSRRLLRSHLIK